MELMYFCFGILASVVVGMVVTIINNKKAIKNLNHQIDSLSTDLNNYILDNDRRVHTDVEHLHRTMDNYRDENFRYTSEKFEAMKGWIKKEFDTKQIQSNTY